MLQKNVYLKKQKNYAWISSECEHMYKTKEWHKVKHSRKQ